jgi:hypothetical protein
MKILHKFFWLLLLTAGVIGAASGIFVAKFSVQEAFAQQISDDPITNLQDASGGFVSPGAGSPGAPDDPRVILSRGIKAVLGIFFITLALLILYAGYLWWSAGGNEEQVKKAKSTFRNAAIGMFIVLSAYGVVTLVFNSILPEAQRSEELDKAPEGDNL